MTCVAEAELADTHHSESKAAHNVAMLKQFLEEQLAQDNKPLKKTENEKTEYPSSLVAGQADLAKAEKSLAAWPGWQDVAMLHDRLANTVSSQRVRSGDNGKEAQPPESLCDVSGGNAEELSLLQEKLDGLQEVQELATDRSESVWKKFLELRQDVKRMQEMDEVNENRFFGAGT